MRPAANAFRAALFMTVLLSSAGLAFAGTVAPDAAPMAKRRSVRSAGPALPSAPIAVADSYEVTSGTTLTVAAPGVLTNDTLQGATITGYGAATGNEQTAIDSITPTAQGGSVRLGGNGGFVFTAAGSFSGTDTFRYTLVNAGGLATGTVTITVRAPASPSEFNVTSPGFFYTFAELAGQNPKLTLVRGRTYTFHIDADPMHPFQIVDAPAGSVTNNNISQGTITFTVPLTAQNYRYICSIHGFGGQIETIAPPPPPGMESGSQ